MTIPRLLRGSIKQVSSDLRSNQLAATALVAESLSLTDQLKHLNCFITVTGDHARESALQTEQRVKSGKPAGSLDGVPIAVKDNFCTNGVRTTCASKMLEGFVPSYNATVYERLQQQGAVLIGKTNLDQFGMGSGTVDSIYGPTKNIWGFNPENWRIAGGSSGGSATAVASGICFGALGSDTGGSTRNPASYCGVVGLKPTYGLVSRHGLIPLVNSMDVPGIMTRNVDDCVEILNTIAGPDPFDSTTIKQPFRKISARGDEALLEFVRSLKIGIPREYHCPGLSPEVQETWSKVADLLEDAGATVKQVSLPNTASSIFVYSILNQCEVASNMARYDGIEYGHRSDDNTSTEQLYASTRAVGFNPVVKGRILAGNFFLLRRNYEKYFQKALRVRRLIANDFVEVFKDVDFLLTPTTLSEAPLFSDFSSNSNRDQCAVQDFCTQPANMAGIPAISLPIRLSGNNLPLSLQLMGDNLSEEGLLTLSRWIEREVKFTERF